MSEEKEKIIENIKDVYYCFIGDRCRGFDEVKETEKELDEIISFVDNQYKQLQECKEENKRLKSQNKLFKGTIKKFNLDWYGERLTSLTQQNKQLEGDYNKLKEEYMSLMNRENFEKLQQQNKQMREALEEIVDYYSPSCDCGLSSISCPDLGVCRLANIAQQALKGVE